MIDILIILTVVTVPQERVCVRKLIKFEGKMAEKEAPDSNCRQNLSDVTSNYFGTLESARLASSWGSPE